MKILTGADQGGYQPLRASACGAVAAFSHDAFMTPFDTVKQRMQLGHYRNLRNCVKTIAFEEGFKAFYKSFPTTLMMNVPYGCVVVAVNESVREFLQPASKKYETSTLLISGSIAGLVAAFVTTPLDLIKTRLQTQNLQACPRIAMAMRESSAWQPVATHVLLGKPHNSKEVIMQIFREEGLAGFLKGAFPRCLTHSLSVAVSWTAYEKAKDFLSPYFHE